MIKNEEIEDHVAALDGTCLQGYVHLTYEELTDALGDPLPDYGDRSQAEWILRFDDGTIATVYDYKKSVPPQRVTEWHVGGRTRHALDLVAAELSAALGYEVPKEVQH